MNAVRPLHVPACIALLCLTACGDAPRPSTAIAPPVSDFSDAPTLSATERTRIDGMANHLVPVSHLVVLPNGDIALTQAQESGVRLFTGAGEDLGIFGGPGSGPGEFVNIAKVGLMSDTLWVWDARQLRITLMGPRRELVRTFLLKNEASGRHSGRSRQFKFLSPEALYNGGAYLASAQTEDVLLLRVQERDESAEIITTLIDKDESLSIHLPDGGVIGGDPFRTYPRYDISPGGHWIAIARGHVTGPDAGSIEVSVLNVSGDTVGRQVLTVNGRRVTSSTADSVMRQLTQALNRSDYADIVRKHVRIPDIFPPVTGILMGDDGSVLLELDRSSGRSYLLLAADGTTIGAFDLPETTKPMHVNGNTIWTIQKDEYDVPSAVSYSLAPANES